MVISYIIIILSIFLDGLISNYITSTSIFLTDFTFLSIILTYKILNKNRKLYLTTIIIISFIYDLLYTNHMFLHTYLYMACSIILERAKKINIKTIVVIFLIYKILYFIILFIEGYIKNPLLIINNLLSSVLSNMIYIILVYLILKKYYKSNKINY